jgi:predicted 2-oxoglutarate/Fe(II)-dependent dioxygenase YbiX/peroxiredoxin
MTIRRLLPGDPAPHFRAPVLGGSDNFAFDTIGGRLIVMLFAGSAGWPVYEAAAETLARYRDCFDDVGASFFGISIDPADAIEKRIRAELPGIRWFLDHDRAVSRLYGAISATEDTEQFHPHWVLLDPTLRIVAREPIDRGEAIMAELVRMIEAGFETPTAPVLVVPRVLDPATCRELIDFYRLHGGEESGFMQDVDGITRHRLNPAFKKRSDRILAEGPLLDIVKARLHRFLLPQIKAAFQFDVTRVERWLVACYDGDNGGGYFRPHRDNTTHGTAHRRFACTINLNAEEYDGGDLRFPEYGRRSYRAPSGGAAVFSCSLLHEALPVTRGQRYALLPFFYDDEGARIRERNLDNVTEDLRSYRSGLPPEEPASAGSR